MLQQHNWAYPPTTSVSPPPLNLQQPRTTDQDDHWKHFDNSVNAVSFGFVATAILISMFLIMAIFERFLRPATSSPSTHRRPGGDLESQIGFNGKLGHPSPKMSVYSNGVSVLMPGENIPTFMAHLAPAPCPPERTPCPPRQHNHSTSNPPTFR